MIPSGNLGNAIACVWARQLGAPIACDRAGAQRQPHRAGLPRAAASCGRAPSVATLSSAMDVGNPSNLERLVRAVSGRRAALRAALSARYRSTMRRSARASAPISSATGGSGARTRAVAAEAYARLAPNAARARPLGAGGDGASGQVSRDRRAADWRTRADAGESGAAVRAASAAVLRSTPTLEALKHARG